ncbi:MAG: hypothetical protein PHO27_12250 [Sulfuricurvum sp.]|jgi:hypothetical protein|nr:hypothetical protein [Sulfuricurvum sp.]
MKTKLVDMKEIRFKDLAVEVKRLNDSGILADKIPGLVGKSKEEVVDLFVKAVQSIPDDENGNWTGPKETGTYYMSLLVAEEKKDVPVSKESTSKKPHAKEKKKSEATGKNGFGHVKGSIAADIDTMLYEGATRDQITDMLLNRLGDKKAASARSRSHLLHMMTRGDSLVVLDSETGVYKAEKNPNE